MENMMITLRSVRDHFDLIANSYDQYKLKNSYYYGALKSIIVNEIGRGAVVLDYGCGTGQILVALEPKLGVGYDISSKMIDVAKKRSISCPGLKFTAQWTEVKRQFDWVVMADVVEHTPDLREDFKKIHSCLKSNGKVLVTFVGPVWEPILMLVERMGLKMPEGPHRRISAEDVIDLAAMVGLSLVKVSPGWWPITTVVLRKAKQ